MWYVHRNTVNIQIFNELTRNFVIDRKNGCGFCYKNYSRSNSLYSMVHQGAAGRDYSLFFSVFEICIYFIHLNKKIYI
jgi:hypothetical protein